MNYLVGNWKMHTSVKEGIRLAQHIKQGVASTDDVTVILCPPFTHLDAMHGLFDVSPMELGAQNMYFEDSGAYTGEISPFMIADYCRYVILGHSERRVVFSENSTLIQKKVRAALNHDIKPILCVGESLDIYEQQKTFNFLEEELTTSLKGIDPAELGSLLIAYEPCWAIGSGHTPYRDEIERVAKFLTVTTRKVFDNPELNIPILYGGSVKANNVAEFASLPHISGVLVGGASIRAEEFCAIHAAMAQLNQ